MLRLKSFSTHFVTLPKKFEFIFITSCVMQSNFSAYFFLIFEKESDSNLMKIYQILKCKFMSDFQIGDVTLSWARVRPFQSSIKTQFYVFIH